MEAPPRPTAPRGDLAPSFPGVVPSSYWNDTSFQFGDAGSTNEHWGVAHVQEQPMRYLPVPTPPPSNLYEPALIAPPAQYQPPTVPLFSSADQVPFQPLRPAPAPPQALPSSFEGASLYPSLGLAYEPPGAFPVPPPYQYEPPGVPYLSNPPLSHEPFSPTPYLPPRPAVGHQATLPSYSTETKRELPTEPQSALPKSTLPLRQAEALNVTVVQPDKSHSRVPGALLSEDGREAQEEDLRNDTRLVKVQEHRDRLDDVPKRTKTDCRVSFINLPRPIISPLFHTIGGSKGPGMGEINDFPGLLKRCQTTKIAYKDVSFPHHDSHSRCGQTPVEWRRIKEVNPRATFCSTEGPSPADVVQGGGADSPFLSAIGALTGFPKLFAQVVPPSQGSWKSEETSEPTPGVMQVNPKEEPFFMNAFHFWFWKWGKWVEVIVDDQLPFIGDFPAFSRCRNPNEYWVPLVEKAYAKLHGSYQAIDCCNVEDVCLDLTGGSCLSMNVLAEKQEDPTGCSLWEKLKLAIDQKCVLFCSVGSEGEEHPRQTGQRMLVEPNGLLLGRPYQVTGTLSVNLSTKKSSVPPYHLIRLSSVGSLGHEQLQITNPLAK